MASRKPAADHPHHSSMWIAADHVHCRMPVAEGRHEDYTYNFYVNDVFQGRAIGRIVETACEGTEVRRDRFRIVQEMEWRGPAEWGAPHGRLAASERRVMEISAGGDAMVIDVASHLGAVDWDFAIGPTRHAYFNLRLAEPMTVSHGGKLFDDRGGDGGVGCMLLGKAFDSFCPIGPFIATDIDPARVRIAARVNGETRQDSHTSDLLFPAARLVSYLSQAITLLPGAMIITGTPSGVGPIVPGDVVDIDIEGIGVLSNPVVAEKAA